MAAEPRGTGRVAADVAAAGAPDGITTRLAADATGESPLSSSKVDAGLRPEYATKQGTGAPLRSNRSVNGSGDITAQLAAEAGGSAALSFVIVAAGLLAERGGGGSIALASLITALAGSACFLALARALSSWAPCLFNPALALAGILSGRLDLVTGLLTAAAQIGAAFLGVMAAHLTTNTGLVQVATQIQTGVGVWTGEVLGTGLLVFTILTLLARGRETLVPVSGAVALLAIALATPSLSFANPALTLARALTDSFTAIRLADAAQIAGLQGLATIAAWLLSWWLSPRLPRHPRGGGDPAID